MRILALAFSALLFLLLAGPGVAEGRYLSAMLGTKHFGTSSLNNFTPGVTIGQAWKGRKEGTEWFLEGGAFYNSYKEISPIALFGTSMSLGHIGETEVRGGLAVGTAYYKELSDRLKDRYGIPNIKGFIPIAAASVALRRKDSEVRFTAVPPDDDAYFVLNISITHKF